MNIYVDGIEIATIAEGSGGGIAYGSFPMILGHRLQVGGNAWPFGGLLDDVRLYNRAIEQPLIERIMNDGFAMFKRRVFFDVAVVDAFVPQVIGPY